MRNNLSRLLEAEPSDAAALSFKPCEEFEKDIKALYSCERFLRTAALLPEGGFLVWQTDGRRAFAYSGTAGSVTPEDLRWIFGLCADVTAPRVVPAPFRRRRVYVLRAVEPDTDITQRCRELLDAMERFQAVLRLSAGPGGGTVLISLPDEMPLRFRAMLAMTFPGLEAQEIRAESGGDGPEPLAETQLRQIMTSLTEELLPNPGEEEPERNDTDEEPERDEANDSRKEGISLEELDLTLRSYNCLRRAGITTVEQLRAMRGSELRRIRNLSAKNLAEIQRKLAETAARPAGAEAKADEEPDPFRQLEALVGLDDVKEHVRKLAAFAKMQQEMARRGKLPAPVVLNMEFVGNPGTAKTTVARIAAGIFCKLGLLPHRDIVEVGRADLIAHYEGQTAGKVRDVFRRARGKLLFIDEAYSLLEDREGSFGDEAISTLVQEMENGRGKTIVVFAGYPDKMAAFFARNPGLRSRVPFRLRFDDYSAEEMVKITAMEAEKRGFSLSPEAETAVAVICRSALRRPEAGNGRFCRNLAESAVLNYADRVCGAWDSASPQPDFVLAAEDFSVPETVRTERRATLGFAV